MKTMMTKRPPWAAIRRLLVLSAFAVTACAENTGPGQSFGDLNPQCSIPSGEILSGAPKDGIPALTDPEMVAPSSAGAAYLSDDARVIGLEVNGQWYGVPLNIMWWHEIVNLNLGLVELAVTHCPLTGSSLAFDRAGADGAEFGVSGLLYLNNLLMYDRSSKESLWPQMARGARCGPMDGSQLTMYPVVEMRWGRLRALHPGIQVVSNQTGYDRDYNRYPYGDYDQPNHAGLLFPMPEPIDERRPPKERVLGIPAGDGGVAYPFGALDELGPVAALETEAADDSVVVLWSRAARSAMAFEPVVDGRALTFEVVNDTIRDRETGSAWLEDGRAVGGTLTGTRLPPVQQAYVAFWFAWAAFQPETALWSAGSS